MRKTQPKKIPLAPDPKFNDNLVTRFVNNLMWAGKKSGAFIIFYDALDKVTKITGESGYEVWKKALGNITPGVEVRSRGRWCCLGRSFRGRRRRGVRRG